MELLLELEVGGNRYRISKLSAKDQTSLFLKITPFMLPVIVASMKGQAPDLTVLTGYLINEMSRLTDVEIDYISSRCLSVVHRQTGEGKFAPYLHSGGLEMFQDVTGPERFELIACSLNENVLKHAKAFTDALTRLASITPVRAT